MLKYIIAFILVLLAWVAWFAIGVFEWVWAPALFTVLVVGVLLSIIVVRRLRARRAARELEKALAAQAAEQARTARPDMQAEILQMQQEFQRAIAALKSSRLARGGENALYALPWNLIIGPPGSGKSTALRNSGLQFPYMSTSGGGVRGVGGTRNCDWWLTNEAVLLDTAGRWAIEEEDRDEWISFLDLVKRFRPEKPLNGIIAAIGLEQLGSAHEEEVGALARRMRERIDEVQQRLQMSLPVYVLFTKADLIPGFVETFTDLSKQERGQVWGFTVPITKPPPDTGMHFAERFDELGGIVEKRSLRRMGEERKIETRELIHSFPQQFATLRKNCTDFVGTLFESSVMGETPMFRGCYFSSGTQEGRPIDRVMHKMAEAFGIRSEVNLGEPVTEAKSYFLRDVFLNVVFPDRDVALRSAAAMARERRNQFIGAGALAFVAALLLILPAWSWANNRELIRSTRGMVDSVQAASADDGVLSATELAPLRRRVAELRDWERRAPISHSFGMYPDDITDPVARYYERILRSQVVGPIVQNDQEAMDEFGRRYEAMRDSVPTGPEHADMYDRLRTHLLMTRPMEDGEPRMNEDEDVREWLAERIARRWIDSMGGEEEVEEDVVREMRQQAREYINLLARESGREVSPEESMRFPRDDDSVRRVRDALTRVSLTDMALERIIQDVEPLNYDLRLVNLVGNTVDPMRSDGLVRGAFTRRGWDARVREALYGETDDRVFGETWVLGAEARQAERTQAQRVEDLRNLRNQYLRRYVEEWRDFLASIRVVPAQGTNNDALRSLQSLTRGDPEPYRLLFQQVLYNTTLQMPDGGESETAGAAGGTFWDIFRRRLERIRGGRAAAAVVDMVQRSPGQNVGDQPEELTPEHVFLAFEGFTEFGAAPPPPTPAEGEAPPPPPALPINDYEAQLDAVRDALQTHIDTPRGTEEAVEGALATARTSTLGLIESQPVGWRPRLMALLWPPIEGSTQTVAVNHATGAGNAWCTDVYTPYARNIQNGYPLNRGGHDVPLADFAAFYMPEEGTLWKFYNESLERRIPQQGDTFSFATNLGQAAGNAYRPDLLQYLERAHDITATFFPPGADGPQIEFDARIQPSVRVATQTLCVGGVCYEHHNGPERWQRFVWPGDSPADGASLEIRGEGGIHERIEQAGEWGMFRLMEQGTVTSTSRGRRIFTMTWRLRDHQVDVAIDIRPVRGDAPFFGVAGRERNPPLMQPLRARDVDPPQQIVSGRSTCRVQ